MASIKRTIIAQQAFDFATLFTMQFSRMKVAGAVVRTPQLLAPETDSTAGGKQALQHISLKPDAPGYMPITVGSVNVAEKSGQLRTYAYLYQMQQQRGRPIDVDSQSYQQFFDSARDFLTHQGFALQVEMQPPPGLAAESAAAPVASTDKTVQWIVIGMMAFVLLLVGSFALYVAILGWPF